VTIIDNWGKIASGLLVTLGVSAAALILCVAIGVVLGVARVVPIRPLRVLATCYVEFFRNIPPLVHLFFFYFALPRIGVVFSPVMCGVLGLAMYHAGYVAEILRAGIQAVGRDQMEAARALGLTYAGAMRHVILPQAVWLVIPPLGNLFISLFKTSALIATIGVADLMYQGEILNERTFRTFEIFGGVGLIYLVFSLGIGAVLQRLETTTIVRRAGHVA
jgi:aspartate/glutamate/glutamine transport system permease protein